MKRLPILLGALLASSSMIAFAPSDGGAAGAAAAPAVETKVIHKQNGIKRPETGSVTGKLWDIADEESAKLGKPAARKAVVDRYMAEQPGANVATANTQYARWVAYHGASDVLRSQRAAEKAEKATATEAAKAAKVAEAEAKKVAKAKEAEDKKAAKEAEKAKKAEEKAAAKKAADEKKAAEEAAAKAAADAAGQNGNSPAKAPKK